MTLICLFKKNKKTNKPPYRYVERRYGTIMCLKKNQKTPKKNQKKPNAQICYAKWKTSRLTVRSALPDGDFRRHIIK